MESNNRLVSVVIPCYNHEKFVQECIESIIDQSFKDIELIIIDDGSKDNSVQKIKGLISECKRRFLRFEFRARPNKGLCATLNEAMEWCEGEFIAVTASDDISLLNRLSSQVDFMISHPDVAACSGGVLKIDEKGRLLKELVLPKPRKYRFDDILSFSYFMPAPTLFFRSSMLPNKEVFDTRFLIEDFYILLKLSSMGHALYCTDKPLAKYRVHESNMSKKVSLLSDARRDLLSYFSSGPKFRRSLAISDMIEATQNIPESRGAAIAKLLRVAFMYPKIVLNVRFFRFIILLFFPRKKVRKHLSL
ncbi:glycosyltransferase [uncultured Marinobacter sp.]|uniref:glycosyltransferase family 2 protein n=1 Tax=uncultured Marinobacter sp. TaxID=187379 RepID=UPI0030D86A8E|tara:strand:+ start:182 stop:1096 length:915 start_codon:yes stop_codon:yes gene_type:complete